MCSEFCTYRIHWMEGNSSRFSLTAPFTTTSRASEIHSLGSARCFFVSCDILEFFCRCKKFFCSICRDGHNAGGPYMPNEGWEDGKGDGAERICFFFPFFCCCALSIRFFVVDMNHAQEWSEIRLPFNWNFGQERKKKRLARQKSDWVNDITFEFFLWKLNRKWSSSCWPLFLHIALGD